MSLVFAQLTDCVNTDFPFRVVVNTDNNNENNNYKNTDINKDTLILQFINKGLGSIRGVFGPMSKISFTLSNYSFVIWDKNYRRYFVI